MNYYTILFFCKELKTADGKVAGEEELREIKRGIWNKTRKFNERFEGKAIMFCDDVTVDYCDICAAGSDRNLIANELVNFVEFIGLRADDEFLADNVNYGWPYLKETTFAGFDAGKDDAESEKLIADERAIYDVALPKIPSYMLRSDKVAKREYYHVLKEKAKSSSYSETLYPEIIRISGTHAVRIPKGFHPCHYIIEHHDNSKKAKEVCETLISALRYGDRISTLRYVSVDADVSRRIDFAESLEYAYEFGEGGTVVTEIDIDGSDDEDVAGGELYYAEKLVNAVKKNSNSTLSIISIPSCCQKMIDTLLEWLKPLNVVVLRENCYRGETTKEQLLEMCKEKGIEADDQLFSLIDPEKGYLPDELTVLFNEWYCVAMTRKYYPQYDNGIEVPRAAGEEKKTTGATDKLDELIGIPEAKRVIKQAVDYFAGMNELRNLGLKVDRPALSMLFTGNPGTCKTTVARLVSEIFYEKGILSGGNIVECGRADLVGKYVGWTARIVKEKFEKARGSVLFIDEAYSLAEDRSGLYGDEAINTIVQEMENHRDDVLVIFAGYPDKMDEFLNKNPGLRSRISYKVHFDDYNPDELCDISALIAKKNGVCLSDDATDKLRDIYGKLCTQPDFGNGRAVRNIIEHAKIAMVSRIMAGDKSHLTQKDVTTILPEDISEPEVGPAVKRRAIGFAS